MARYIFAVYPSDGVASLPNRSASRATRSRLKTTRSRKQERWDGLGYFDADDWGVRNTVRRACTDAQAPLHPSGNRKSGYSDGY